MTSLGAIALGALVAVACAGPLPNALPTGQTSAIVDPPRRRGKPLVVIAMPDSASFQTVRRTLVGEIKNDFDVVTRIVDSRTSLATFSAAIQAERPAGLVLMDNPTLKLYRAHGDAHPEGLPAAVVVMSSFLEEIRADLRNATGVAFEVPGVTAFVNLRLIIERPVNRVAVLCRPPLRRFVERQKALAAREQIAIVPVEVSGDPTVDVVRSALRSLRTIDRVDALWVLNDNGLLKDVEFLENAWRPEVMALDVPVVVGVPALVSGEARFGTFAVLPDLEALGLQAANVLFEVADNYWRALDHPIELPVSTITIVNVRQVRKHFGLRGGALQRIDKAVE